jgi:hypothetical protein
MMFRMSRGVGSWLSAVLGTAVLIGLVTAAPADDTAATLGVGGLRFQHSRQVRMVREDLYISPVRVRVHFELVNVTSKPIDTVVAFPLPKLDQAAWYNSELGTTARDSVNFIDFKTDVNGKPVPMTVEQRAVDGKGRDITAFLKRYHVPINPVIVFRATGRDPLASLPPATVRALRDAHLLGGRYWTVSTNFWWRQRFDPGKVVDVDQSYRPITGGHYDVNTGSLENVESSLRYDLDKDTCPDARTRAALRAKYAATPACRAGACAQSYIHFYTTDYVLTTGGDWDGPIGTFHLTLDKLKSSNILSTCWEAPLGKTGPSTYESTLHDFSPRKNLRILVIE